MHLHLVTDRSLTLGRSLIDIIRAAVAGGVSAVQLREKSCSTRDFIELAQSAAKELQGRVPLIINDRIDVALAIGADGIHIGQSDMPYEMARELMGPQALIGLSVETVEQAQKAEGLNVDYLGLSPVFTTATKADIAPPLGLAGVRQIRLNLAISLLQSVALIKKMPMRLLLPGRMVWQSFQRSVQQMIHKKQPEN